MFICYYIQVARNVASDWHWNCLLCTQRLFTKGNW